LALPYQIYAYIHLPKKVASTTMDNASFGISTKKGKDKDKKFGKLCGIDHWTI
jgi:hypothetical protein